MTLRTFPSRWLLTSILPFMFTFGFMHTAQAIPIIEPKPPTLSAEAYLLIDFATGKVLASNHADLVVEPASLTKLMTAYVLFSELSAGNIRLADKVFISKNAWRMEGSKMFVQESTYVKLDDLLKGMIVQSGNDAAVALAEHTAGDEAAFATMMNATAQALGLTQTHFENATGLPAEGHVTTAQDLATLATRLIRDFPEYYQNYYQLKSFTYAGIQQYNRNKLLWQDPSVDGMKTGYTQSAGYCLVASAVREDMRLISVITGTTSKKARIGQSQRLLNFGFRFYQTKQLYEADKVLDTIRIWEGEVDELNIGSLTPIFLTAPRSAFANLQANIEVSPELKAPIKKGEAVGQITIRLNNEVLSTYPVVAMDEVKEGTFFKKAWDQLLLLIDRLMAMIGL